MGLIWDPLDIHAALEFLSHPVCPVPRYARERLAEQMALCPGLHRASFGQDIADIRKHYGDRSMEVEKRIDFCHFAARPDVSQGAPTDELASRTAAVRDFFRNRMRASEGDECAALHAAHN